MAIWITQALVFIAHVQRKNDLHGSIKIPLHNYETIGASFTYHA